MNSNRRLARLPAAMILAAGFIANAALAAEEGAEKSRWGDVRLDFRYRLELVDQEPFTEDATASTLRTRINYQSPDADGVSVFAEYDYVAEIGADDYNAGSGNTPDRTQYPVVADPDGGDLNQAYLQFARSGHQVRAGRQRIVFDNARFVGDVGWRQNPQTYDAFSYAFKSEGGLQFTAAYVNKVLRIFGDDVPAGKHDNDTVLVNFSRALEGVGTIGAYWYDIDNDDSAAFSTTTWGARFNGTTALNDTKLGYGLEFAKQGENANNPTPFDANYYRLDLSAGFGAVTLYAGFESLGGDQDRAGQSFRTPLATLHAFNGWADKFLATPDAGLEDAFIGAKGKVGSWDWNVLYHDFSAESGSQDFGCELDASLSTKLAGKFGLLLKAADFNSDSPAYGDTRKIWVQLTAGFDL